MYVIDYFMNDEVCHYTFVFNSLWGATFKARAISEEHGFKTDVIDFTTGEVLIRFDHGKCFMIADHVSGSARYLAIQELE